MELNTKQNGEGKQMNQEDQTLVNMQSNLDTLYACASMGTKHAQLLGSRIDALNAQIAEHVSKQNCRVYTSYLPTLTF